MFLLTIIISTIILATQAAIYVIKPSEGSTCYGGETCTVQWLDDGQRPLLSAIKTTTVGLYHGEQKLVQALMPVDVSNSISFSFTPDSEAGPSSNTYYISFSSVDLQANGSAYQGFSPFFRLDHMSGSFASPLPSATSSIPIPSSTTSNRTETTIIVGTLSTSLPALSSLPATAQQTSSGFLTTASSTSATTTTSTSNPKAGSNAMSKVTFPSLRCIAMIPMLLYFSL